MGGVPTKHHSHAKVRRRRSHLALKPKSIQVCSQCRGPIMPHRACAQCGLYPGKSSSSQKKTATLNKEVGLKKKSAGALKTDVQEKQKTSGDESKVAD